mgnify:CR=1 FL=1
MSKKNVIVSNVSEGQLMQRALWELWRLIHPMECRLIL